MKIPDSRPSGLMERDQTLRSFGYQWTHCADWSMSGEAHTRAIQWILDKYGWKTEAGLVEALQGRRRILDVGCGQGRELLLFRRVNPTAMMVGLEPSEAVQVARGTLAMEDRVSLVQGNLFEVPLKEASFDFIFANGVLHHTRSTREALAHCRRLLCAGGEVAAYIYRKKAPIREYADDYLRSLISRMEPEEAWEACRGLTELGQQLSELNAEITLRSGVPALGIRPGRHSVQRLLYVTMLKMFWDPARGFEGSTLVNFDWYHPAYAWRHTAEEIKQWCGDLKLTIARLEEDEYGLTVRAFA